MSQHPPTTNDVIILHMLGEGPLKTQQVQDRSNLFESVAKESSQLGRYLLEKARLRGWAERRVDSLPGRRMAVSYHITDAGRLALQGYAAPKQVHSNGATVVGP